MEKKKISVSMVTAVVVCAGAGLRMGAEIRKQYMSLYGVPILRRCLDTFIRCERIDSVCLVVPQDDIHFCRNELLQGLPGLENVHIVAGGLRRQDSVRNGLQAVDPHTDIVLIQDGVRPFTTAAQIGRCLDGLGAADGCVLAVAALDTLKRTDADGRIVATVDRSDIWMAQTPQAFRMAPLLAAHSKAGKAGEEATDDARLVEQNGGTVVVVPGNRTNIKITTAEDLKLAEVMLRGGMFGEGPID